MKAYLALMKLRMREQTRAVRYKTERGVRERVQLTQNGAGKWSRSRVRAWVEAEKLRGGHRVNFRQRSARRPTQYCRGPGMRHPGRAAPRPSPAAFNP
ncbi:unnamed protein product, partial [Iphiclides podalirius]